MPITSISRDNYSGEPGIVRLTTTNTLEQVEVTNYILSQKSIINSLNKGLFEWVQGDFVAVSASDGNGIFAFSGNNFNTLIPLTTGELVLLNTVVLAGPFTSTYQFPTNALYSQIYLLGAGGGGGGVADGGGGNTFSAGGGGGAGAVTRIIFSISNGGSTGLEPYPSDGIITLTLTSGGAGGIGALSGATGGNSSFSTIDLNPYNAFGGSGGAGATGVANTAAHIVAGGTGGSSGAGGLTVVGNNGGAGFSILGQVISGEGSGTDFYGSTVSRVNTGSNGQSGGPNGFGVGGSGAAQIASGSFNGGAGGPGAIFIYNYGVFPQG